MQHTEEAVNFWKYLCVCDSSTAYNVLINRVILDLFGKVRSCMLDLWQFSCLPFDRYTSTRNTSALFICFVYVFYFFLFFVCPWHGNVRIWNICHSDVHLECLLACNTFQNACDFYFVWWKYLKYDSYTSIPKYAFSICQMIGINNVNKQTSNLKGKKDADIPGK